MFDKIVRYINRLEKYFIIKQEKNYLILGTVISIEKHKKIFGNIFQPFTQNVTRQLPVFFVVKLRNLNKALPQELKELIKQDIPMLELDKRQLTKKEIAKALESFVGRCF